MPRQAPQPVPPHHAATSVAATAKNSRYASAPTTTRCASDQGTQIEPNAVARRARPRARRRRAAPTAPRTAGRAGARARAGRVEPGGERVERPRAREQHHHLGHAAAAASGELADALQRREGRERGRGAGAEPHRDPDDGQQDRPGGPPAAQLGAAGRQHGHRRHGQHPHREGQQEHRTAPSRWPSHGRSSAHAVRSQPNQSPSGSAGACPASRRHRGAQRAWVRASRSAAVSTEPSTTTAATTRQPAGHGGGEHAARQRSVLPNGPPLSRAAPRAGRCERREGRQGRGHGCGEHPGQRPSRPRRPTPLRALGRPGPRARRTSQVAAPVAELVEHEAPGPGDSAGAGHGAVEVRPGEPAGEQHEATGHQPSASAAPAPERGGDAERGEHVRGTSRRTAASSATRSRRVYQGLSAYSPRVVPGLGGRGALGIVHRVSSLASTWARPAPARLAPTVPSRRAAAEGTRGCASCRRRGRAVRSTDLEHGDAPVPAVHLQPCGSRPHPRAVVHHDARLGHGARDPGHPRGSDGRAAPMGRGIGGHAAR